MPATKSYQWEPQISSQICVLLRSTPAASLQSHHPLSPERRQKLPHLSPTQQLISFCSCSLNSISTLTLRLFKHLISYQCNFLKSGYKKKSPAGSGPHPPLPLITVLINSPTLNCCQSFKPQVHLPVDFLSGTHTHNLPITPCCPIFQFLQILQSSAPSTLPPKLRLHVQHFSINILSRQQQFLSPSPRL